jgi:indolepyruvate ferredoxin oxidoreductase beta subunit
MTSADREPFRLLLAGVGGQGILTAARCLGDAAVMAGQDVVIGQLHGMAQRGGSVRATVLIGPGLSSFIADGAADAVLALEPLEALRARPKMSPATRVVVNLGPVVPYTLAQQGREYPDVAQILAEVRAVAPELTTVDGPALVKAAGAARGLNVVMLGALAGLEVLPLASDTLWEAIASRLPARHLDTSRRAFASGREAAC